MMFGYFTFGDDQKLTRVTLDAEGNWTSTDEAALAKLNSEVPAGGSDQFLVGARLMNATEIWPDAGHRFKPAWAEAEKAQAAEPAPSPVR